MLVKLPSYLRFLVVNQKTDNLLCSLTKPLREEYHTGCLRDDWTHRICYHRNNGHFPFGAKRIPELARNWVGPKENFMLEFQMSHLLHVLS